MRRYDAVLFDLGYTLVYFEPPQEVIVQEALAAIGAQASGAEILAAVEVVWGDYYRDAETAEFPATEEHDRQAEMDLSRGLLRALGLEGDDRLHIYREALEAGFGRPGVLRPYPEVPEVLRTLRARGYRLAIVSNWSWSLRQRVVQAGLDGNFEVVWGSAYAGCSKPHPRIFRQALADLAVEPGRAMFVGDSYRHDVVGARRVGMDAVLVDRGAAPAARDCPVIGDLRGLLPLVEETAGGKTS